MNKFDEWQVNISCYFVDEDEVNNKNFHLVVPDQLKISNDKE